MRGLRKTAPARRRAVAACAALAVLGCTWFPKSAQAQDGGPPPITEKVSMVLADRENLQHLAFWVAHGGGFFARQGLEVDVRFPRMPVLVDELLGADFEAGVLPPPVYLELISNDAPVVLVANLLANDAINLVARREWASGRELQAGTPVRQRLLAMRGARVGVAPGPVIRLRALFAAEGLSADELLQVVVVPGPEQNDAFAQGKVDALFAHTPFLERALLDQDAVMVINLSAGEAPALAGRQIHALVVSRALLASRPAVVQGLVRAVVGASRLVHEDRRQAAAAVRSALPGLEPRLVDAVLPLYAPAIPADPAVTTDGLVQALALFPPRKRAPDFTGKDLTPFIDSGFAARAVAELPPARAGWSVATPMRGWWYALVGGVALAGAAVAALLWRARRRGPPRPRASS